MLDIDLRKEFDILLKEYGIYVIHIKTNRYLKCKCYNPLHKVGDVNCKKCYGRGYVSTMNKVKAIQKNSPAGATIDTGIGAFNIKNKLLYFKYDYRVNVNDVIVIAGYNKNGVPVEVYDCYTVTDVRPIRCDNGRVELNGIHVTTNLTMKTKILDTFNKLDICNDKSLLRKEGCYCHI